MSQVAATARMQRVYFAAPLFCLGEKEINLTIAQRIETELGLSVFLPQRDGLESEALRKEGLPEGTISRQVFELDLQKIMDCRVFIAFLDGIVPDPGVCVETGLAHMHTIILDEDRIMIGLRTGRFNHGVGAMVAGSLEKICSSVDELIGYLRQRLSQQPWYTPPVNREDL